MTPRSIRRAAERKAAKLARKQQQRTPAPGLSQQDSGFVREVEREMAEEAPRGNHPKPAARRCTGPTTPEGKAISSLNRLKHGLAGSFRVLEFESQSQFDELRDALRQEHAPATPTETILVDRLAEHVWLSRRAQCLQDEELLDGTGKGFALFLRYQTTNDRAFYRCLRELATLRRERRQFESQNANAAISAAASKAPAPATQAMAHPGTQPPLKKAPHPESASNRKMPATPSSTPSADHLRPVAVSASSLY